MCLGMAGTAAAQEEKPGAIGVRVGIGTDIQGGIAYGAQLNYTLFQRANAVEMGLAVFGGNFEETSDNDFNEYHEETTILVFGAIVNYLVRYSLDTGGVYFLVGAGVGAISVEREERSDTDTSLGTPLPGGGSMQSEEGTTAGVIINFGLGYRFNKTFDLRAQVPTFFISGGENRDGKVVPTITLTAGLSF
jgi:hypothetical protein